MLAPRDEPEQPVDGLEQRQRQLVRQGLPDRVLWSVRGPSPEGRGAQSRQRIVAQMVRDRSQECGPAGQAGFPCGLQETVGVPRSNERRLVDRAQLVTGGRADASVHLRQPRQASKWRGVSGSPSRPGGETVPGSGPTGPGMWTTCMGSRLRSEPLTRIRNE